MNDTTWRGADPGTGARPPESAGTPLRAADVTQLEAAYGMHREECAACTADASCDIGRRLEQARAGAR